MRIRHYLTLALALTGGLPALAAVAAPAASEGERTTVQAILTQDPRLVQPVTLRMKKSPLSAVAAALSRETSVVMTAARDVADEPAIVYVAAQPARAVMHQLAQVFNYRWTRTGKPGAYQYEIYQDLKSRQEEEALRERDRMRALQALQTEFRDYLEWTRRPPEELRKAAAEYDAIERQLVARRRLRGRRSFAGPQAPRHDRAGDTGSALLAGGMGEPHSAADRGELRDQSRR